MGAATIGKDNIALEKKKQSALTKAVKRVKRSPEGKVERRNVVSYRRGIIMLKHIPHGFYEKEMQGYFSQFGRVLRVRVARSEKTGKSRGYAFVEFEFEEVAKIAAEAMNNYLMFERLIKCELLPPEVKSRNIFQERHIREDNYPKLKSREHATKEQNCIMTQEQVQEVMEQRQKKIQEQNKLFAEMGIDYHFQAPTKGHEATRADSSDADEMEKRPDSSKPRASRKQEKSVGSPAVFMRQKTPVKKGKDLSTIISPKLARNVESQVVVECDNAKRLTAGKKNDLAKISPKMLRSRKSQGPSVMESEFHEAKKSKDLPRISPKVLRSRKSHGPSAVVEAVSYDVTKTPTAMTKDLPRISPKLLRSRKSQGGAAMSAGAGSQDVKKTPAEKRKELPRISPKFLRSRKSDASSLTPLAGKAAPSTPTKQKKATRKSVF